MTTPAPTTIVHVSDLHLTASAPLPPAPAVPEATLALVTGDVANAVETAADLGTHSPGTDIVNILNDELFPIGRFPDLRIALVPGNHDRYGKPWEECLERWQTQAAATGRVVILNNDVLDHQGWRILGTPLWSPAAGLTEEALRRGITDFRMPPPGRPGHWSVADHRAAHALARAWLLDNLDEGDPSHTIVATHWVPGTPMNAPAFKNNNLNPYFCAELPAALLGTPHCWLFGHTHARTWGHIGHIRDRGWYGSNPRGYHSAIGISENSAPYTLRRIRFTSGAAPAKSAIAWPIRAPDHASTAWWAEMLDRLGPPMRQPRR